MKRWKLVLVTIFQISGILLFIHGFLLIKKENNNKNLITEEVIKLKLFKRLILIVIDGLRYDYAKKYMTKTLNYCNSSLFIHTYSDPPTVTLQRIKAIATGTLPVFIEIGSNFDSVHSIQADNFIDNFKNITVVGDDTWNSLFGSIISQDFTVPSFDVHDIDGVDQYIFSKLPEAINSYESDLIVGHFLGVDHAGHVFDYHSGIVKSKISKIDSFITNEIMPNVRDEDLLLVISDHGMTDSGSHGGASFEETSSFLYAYSPSQQLKQMTIGQINQIDICSTISLLFGFPIPLMNVGKIIPDFFPNVSQAISSNVKQLRKMLEIEQIFINSTDHELGNDVYKYFKQKYGTFCMWQMILGCAFIIISIFLLPKPTSIFPIIHSLSMFSDSFIFGENLVVEFFAGFTSNSILVRILGFFVKCREDTHRRICPPIKRIKVANKFFLVKLIGSNSILPFILFLVSLVFSSQKAESIYFLELQGFFGTGHQCTFSDLNIESGYVLGYYHNIISPLCVFINTYMCEIVSLFFIKEMEKLHAYHTYTLICIMGFAIYGRHHLMIWQVIAPRLLFCCVSQLISLFGLVFHDFLDMKPNFA